MPDIFGPPFCGGIDWTTTGHHDPWRCLSVMTEYRDGQIQETHQCAASYGHDGDHMCALGHQWRKTRPRRRRYGWRHRLRRQT